MAALEIPKNKKSLKWDAKKNRYIRTILGRYPGDEGLEMEGRFYSYHPTKGWRSRAIGESKDFSKAPGLIQWLRQVFLRKGIIA